jgi:hypothetical protein
MCGHLCVTYIVCRYAADKMKPVMTAKLSLQCSDLYADAMKLLHLESIKSLWPKVSYVSYSMVYVDGISNVMCDWFHCLIMFFVQFYQPSTNFF